VPELETVDLIGVEILSTGGPVHGVGSPPEGDFWTTDDLRAMAAADAELGDEIKPPNKLGHSDQQTLLENSGLKPPSPGELPAIGWLENLRLNADGTKLLADVMSVPKTVADIITAGGYRTRSVELSKVTSQATGKVYDWVVTGLAWLGGKMPAVRTLDDVVALYHDDGVILQRVVAYAAGEIAWSPDQGYYALRAQVLEALNGPGDAMIDGRFWVRDIADDRALVMDYFEDEETAWIVPFTRTADGVEVADRDEWTRAAMAWVETARDYEERALELQPRSAKGAPDTRPVTAPKFTDEQRRTFAEATGLDIEKVTDELLEKAGVSSEEPQERNLEADERFRQLEEKATTAAETARKLEQELAEERKRSFVESVLSAGKAAPGARAEIEAMYDASPDAARKFFDSVKPNDDLSREYGSGELGDDDTPEAQEKRDLAEREQIARAYGLDMEEVA